MPRTLHRERHRTGRLGWLRAAVLGANDGIVSTSALVIGVAASGATPAAMFTSGIAGAVAGAMSMAAGEYVSVRSQSDTEAADLVVEQRELAEQPGSELSELASIYRNRGLSPDLADRVAVELSAKNVLEAHARDELGIIDAQRARPIQAALASAVSFAVGSALPIVGLMLAPPAFVARTTFVLTMASLLITGALAARIGGAPVVRGALRLAFWGLLAMIATNLVGRIFNAPP